MSIIPFALRVLVGLALAFLFYGGLWLTVQRLLVTQNPASVALTSLFVRTALAVSGFIWAAAGNWQYLLTCVLGFELGRLLITRTRRCT
jgi:F1F0 ATPase subunit 2